MGWGGNFRGPNNQKAVKCHELARKSKKISKPGGGGWGGILGGQKIKSPGSVMNCPEKKMLNPGGGWGGVEVLGVKIL